MKRVGVGWVCVFLLFAPLKKALCRANYRHVGELPRVIIIQSDFTVSLSVFKYFVFFGYRQKKVIIYGFPKITFS